MDKKTSVVSLGTADKDGWLTKQGGSYKSWKRRWFVLKGSTLYYFKSPKDTSLTGVIELSAQCAVKRDPSCKKSKLCFAVVTPHRTFLMFPDANKQGDTEAWIHTLHNVITGKKPGQPSVAIKESENKQSNIPKPVSTPSMDFITSFSYLQGGPNGSIRAALLAAKDYVPFLNTNSDENKVVEFWQIWSESIPTQSDLTDGAIVFEITTSCTMEKLSWRCCGPQNLFIQKMVDFFWNVGAPESEIDRLNDVGALVNPAVIGSWIDMSSSGGMDGGWFFPVESSIKNAIKASDEGPAIEKVDQWCQANNITKSNCVGRDMGAAPPRQTEIRFPFPNDNCKNQLIKAKSAYDTFGFPFPPEEALQTLQNGSNGGLALSIVTSSEGFVRLGLMFPKPSAQAVASLCSMSNASIPVRQQFQQALNVDGPAWAELQFLNEGFGYGVYNEGFEVAFHYLAGSERPL